MTRIFVAATMLLLCAGFGSSSTSAQGRGPTANNSDGQSAISGAERLAEVAELKSWLRRLVGRYRLVKMDTEGISNDDVFERSKSIMDCSSIGTGAGVNCVGGGMPFEGGPRRIAGVDLYGVDPDQLVIRHLDVGSGSIAEVSVGKMVSGAMRFSGHCAKKSSIGTVVSCDREMRWEIPAAGKRIRTRVFTRQRIVPSRPTFGSGRTALGESTYLLQYVATLEWERVSSSDQLE